MPQNRGWKGPTLKDIATVAGVGPATVDRVLNGRAKVREKTRIQVLAALEKLSQEGSHAEGVLDLRLFCDSGESFNATMENAVAEVNRSLPGVRIRGTYVATNLVDPMAFGRALETEGSEADGVIVIAREHPAVNRAIRKLTGLGIPVICLTSDLPSSRRNAYIGNDQYSAGSVAAVLIGNALPKKERHNILLVMSVPFRTQSEREMGFRRVLRSDYPNLRIEERVISNDDPVMTRDQLLRHFEANGVPAAIYNVGGGNRGVAQALEAVGKEGEVVFVGYELSSHARNLLEAGVMDYVISHDFAAEVNTAALAIKDVLEGRQVLPAYSQILVHTKYNCGN